MKCRFEVCGKETINDKAQLCQEHFLKFVDDNFRMMLYWNTVRLKKYK